MPAGAPNLDPRSPLARSRITNGGNLLPSVDGRSVWARLFRDVIASMVSHLGGEQHITEPLRLLARRVAALEAELIHLEDHFASLRVNGHTPKREDLDLYGRLSGHQHRILQTVGLDRRQMDVTPDPLRYAREFDAEDCS